MTRSRLDGIRLEFSQLFACLSFTRNTHFARALVTTIACDPKSALAPEKRQDKVDATSPVRTIHATRARRRREGRGGRKKIQQPSTHHGVSRSPRPLARRAFPRLASRRPIVAAPSPPRRRSRTIFLPSTLPGRRGRGEEGRVRRRHRPRGQLRRRRAPEAGARRRPGPRRQDRVIVRSRGGAPPHAPIELVRVRRVRLLRPGVAGSGHRGRRPRGALRRSFPGRRRRMRGARRRHRQRRSLPGRVRRRRVRQDVQIQIQSRGERGRPVRHDGRHLPRRQQPDGRRDDIAEPRLGGRGRGRRERGRVRAVQLLLLGFRRRRRHHPRHVLHALRRGRGVLG